MAWLIFAPIPKQTASYFGITGTLNRNYFDEKGGILEKNILFSFQYISIYMDNFIEKKFIKSTFLVS